MSRIRRERDRLDGRDGSDVQHLSLDDLRRRAERHLSTTPRPFLRWAGSKRALLSSIVPVLPKHFRTYFEPFLGSGALFFLLRPRSAVLGDNCAELLKTYRAVRDNVSAVARYLLPLKPRKRFYYHLRDNRAQGRFKRAAEFIFLNKSCWNGLYRVNSEGAFNTPFGLPKTDNLVDPDNLRACSGVLKSGRIRLLTEDFEETLATAGPGDLVYLDPPYVTRHNNNGFAEWNERLFSWKDQERLASLANELARRRVSVLVSNANHDEVLRLYRDFPRIQISRFSTLASSKWGRGPVTEVLFYSTPPRGST